MKKDNKANHITNKILEVSFQLFQQKGYGLTTTREIADLSGISRGHLRYYFNRKEDLFYQFAQSSRRRLVRPIVDACASTADLYLFYLILIRCYVFTIYRLPDKESLETLQWFDSVTKYQNGEDYYLLLLTNYSDRCELSPHPNKEELKRFAETFEIVSAVAMRLAYDRILASGGSSNRYYDDPDSTLSSEDQIWIAAASHGLYALRFDSSKAEALIAKADQFFREQEIGQIPEDTSDGLQ